MLDFYVKLYDRTLAAMNAIGPMTYEKCDGMMLQEAANMHRELSLIIRKLEVLNRIADRNRIPEYLNGPK